MMSSIQKQSTVSTPLRVNKKSTFEFDSDNQTQFFVIIALMLPV